MIKAKEFGIVYLSDYEIDYLEEFMIRVGSNDELWNELKLYKIKKIKQKIINDFEFYCNPRNEYNDKFNFALEWKKVPSSSLYNYNNYIHGNTHGEITVIGKKHNDTNIINDLIKKARNYLIDKFKEYNIEFDDNDFNIDSSWYNLSNINSE
jgi:hypothetical protein